jgi:protein phosphatase
VTVVLVDVAADGAQVPSAPVAAASKLQPERERTDPDVGTAPPAVDTGVHRIDEVPALKPRSSRGGFSRALTWALLGLLLIAGGVFAASRYTLSNSYFVGTDEGGMVTIYRGIPDEIAGITLKESEEQTDVAVDELPDFLRGDVEEGIKADSLDDARQKVENLKERADDADFDKASAGGKSN